jgi:alkanesulfonate monooxygenase SsuD/methylene tetrahydromethanopterin reductase-like flavin-dependent oxidoreductase (luciferase family)
MSKIGVTLPSFAEDPEPAIEVARAAEAAGVDGVFVYDHIFRDGPSGRRPALECFALLGAIAAETSTIAIGTLVARATLRPPAVLAHSFATVQRVSGGRVIAGIGAGDRLSRAENESYGLEFGTRPDRVEALHDAARALRDGGYPVWIGGKVAQVRELVALADGWNRWGGSVDEFAREERLVREVAPDAVVSWGGLVSYRTDVDRPDVIAGKPEHVAERLRRYVDAGAAWVVVGPIDASNPENASVTGELVKPLV